MISSRFLLKCLSAYILARTAKPDKANLVCVATRRQVFAAKSLIAAIAVLAYLAVGALA